MRIFVIKKSTIIRAAVFLLLVVGAIVYTQVTIGDAEPVSNQSEQMPVCRVATDEKVVALTFDTAFGDADYTEAILASLQKEGVRATFFVMGLWANQNDAQFTAMSEAGHELASHSMNHERYTGMSQEQIINDASAAAELIKNKTGKETRVIRMPYGAFDTASIMALNTGGYIPVKWSLDSKDWKGHSADKIAESVLADVQNGDIIMFQNNMEETSKALPAVILGLRERGFKVVTISDLLIDADYIVDAKGTQRHFQD